MRYVNRVRIDGMAAGQKWASLESWQKSRKIQVELQT